MIEYITNSGDDVLVVNAARVSYNKRITQISDRDVRLLHYLARHEHWTPFAHPQITFCITMPIFVARQWFKHTVGLIRNEVSRRYVDEEPEFFIPNVWRGRPEVGQSKQGSSGPIEAQQEARLILADAIGNDQMNYRKLLDLGVAPEQARMVLGQNMQTTFYETGSLYAYRRIVKERTAPEAQQETRVYAESIAAILKKLYPKSWEALTDTRPGR